MRKVSAKNVKVPRKRWGGRWMTGLTELADGPADNEFYVLSPYGRTTAYQVARELNLAASLPPGVYEFGVVEGEKTSELVARRVA